MNTLSSQLAQYAIHFSEEAESTQAAINLYTQFKDTTPSCFCRSQLNNHFTGSGFVIRIRDGKVETLLTHHKKLGIWVQPGGHADGNANLLEVAATEVLEETGLICQPLMNGTILDIDIHPIPASKQVPAHYHYDVRYLFLCPGDDEFVVSEESIALAWISLDDLIENSAFEPSLKRMATKTLNYLSTHIGTPIGTH